MFEWVTNYDSPSGGYIGLYGAKYNSTGTLDALVEIANEGLENDLYTNDAAGTHSHDIEIPDHTHDIEYGIYEFEYLPTKLTLKVDGTTVTTNAPLSDSDFDIIPYLSKTSGKVNRGAFHTVEIIPNTTANNPDGLARINASVVKQIFVQSRGGGDY